MKRAIRTILPQNVITQQNLCSKNIKFLKIEEPANCILILEHFQIRNRTFGKKRKYHVPPFKPDLLKGQSDAY